MKRLLTSAAVAAVMVAGTGSGAHAQAGNSLFDLSLYGGIGYNYRWLQNLDETFGEEDGTYSPGWAPHVGAAATFWASPMFGVRTNVVYQDIDMEDEELAPTTSHASVNGWLYDLNLVFRPWIERDDMNLMMSSLYLFVGGGGFTANPPGSELGCVAPFAAEYGACLPLESDKATVGQGTFGLGVDVASLAANVGIFAELAGYVYDSPFHTGPPWTALPVGYTEEEIDDVDAYSFTPRLSAGLKFLFGERAPAVVPVPVTPTPPPAPAPPPPPPPPAERNIRVCVVQGTALTEVDAVYVPAQQDTFVVVSGTRRPFTEVYPAAAPAYAGGETWYINNDSIRVNDRDYVRFGVARVIPPAQLTRVADYQGVGLYAETGGTTPHQVLYVPLRPGCEFQPYQLREQIRVRG